MKRLTTIWAFIIPLCILCNSCLMEELEPCVENIFLSFSYHGDTNDPTMFDQKIDRVTLMIYDDNEFLLETHVLEKDELLKSRGTTLHLNPGIYHVVCWGNAFEDSEMVEYEVYPSGRLHHPLYTKGGQIPTNNSLYHGICELNILPNETSLGNIEFKGAHIDIHVYFRNATTSTLHNIEIKTHNLMPQYDFEMHSIQPYSTTYYPSSRYNEETKYHECFFQVLRFDDENPVMVELKDATGKIHHIVDLEEYMTDNDITVNGKNEAIVPILFEYTNLGIIVKVPEWEGTHVTPET